jgi:hypothetical protein
MFRGINNSFGGIRGFLFLAKLGGVALWLSACEPSYYAYQQSPVDPPSSPACSGNLTTTTQNLRIMIMVDNSGSTRNTDPNHKYRVETMQNFIHDYGSKPNFSYSFGIFAQTALLYNDPNQNFIQNAPTPFGNYSDLTNALIIFISHYPAQGSTAYLAAFSAMKAAITKDVSLGNHWNYVIIFMSDGQPTDISGAGTDSIKTAVKGLQAAAQTNGGLLTISSVYFGPKAASAAIERLKVLAQEGKGQFIDTNKLGGSGLVLDDVISIPGSTCKE